MVKGSISSTEINQTKPALFTLDWSISSNLFSLDVQQESSILETLRLTYMQNANRKRQTLNRILTYLEFNTICTVFYLKSEA